jgi:EPS-associated MarR family transcriptional regulator
VTQLNVLRQRVHSRVHPLNTRTVPLHPDSSASDEDSAVALLRLLEEHPEYSQRQLARELGVSLGKAHYLLKALLAKGWVKAQNFQRSDRKLGYLYVLTPSGIRERLRMTQAFLARKEREYVQLRSQISALRKDVAEQEGTQS